MGHTRSRWQLWLKILNDITFSLDQVDRKQRNFVFNLGLQPQMSHYACVNIPKCKAVWRPFGPVHLWWGVVTKEYMAPCQHLPCICLLSLSSFHGCFIEHRMTNLEKLIMILTVEARKVIYVLGGRESRKLLEVSWYPSLSWAFTLSPASLGSCTEVKGSQTKPVFVDTVAPTSQVTGCVISEPVTGMTTEPVHWN